MRKRVLFVCDGNTCLSPMAAVLAKKMYGDLVQPESAGLDAGESSARRLAIEVMREDYDVDISSHRPRDIDQVDLDTFDLVVAMQCRIADELTLRFELAESTVITWAIDDPATMGNRRAYEECAADIESRLRELRDRCGQGS